MNRLALVLLIVLFAAPSSSAAVFFDEDFEGTVASMQSSGWGFKSASGNMVLTTGQHFTGAQSLQMVYPATSGAQTSSWERVFTATDHIFVRFVLKVSTGFVIGDNGLSKIVNVCGQNMFCNNWFEQETTSNLLEWNVNTYDRTTERLHTGFPVADNQWHQIEAEWLFNTPGVANGLIRIWVDNVLKFESLNRQLRGPNPGSVNVDGLLMGSNSRFDYMQFYQQAGLGTVWVDRFALGDTRIGVVGGVPPPSLNAPANLLLCTGSGCTPALVVPLGALAGLLVWVRRRLKRSA